MLLKIRYVFFCTISLFIKKNQKIPIDWEYVLSFGCIYGFNKTTFSKKKMEVYFHLFLFCGILKFHLLIPGINTNNISNKKPLIRSIFPILKIFFGLEIIAIIFIYLLEIILRIC